MNCLSVLKAEFSPTVPILGFFDGPSPTLLCSGKRHKDIHLLLSYPEKSDNAHQQQYPYLQGLFFFFMSVLLLVLSLIEKLKIIAIISARRICALYFYHIIMQW